MTDAALLQLAEASGVGPRWKNFQGEWHDVAPDTLRTVLAALGIPASSPGDVEASLALAGQDGGALPPLVTAEAGQPIMLPARPGPYKLVLEGGTALHGQAAAGLSGQVSLPAVDVAGYHRLSMGSSEVTLAVAPRSCFGVQDAALGRRPWVLAVQLYSLRREGDAGLGDFEALRLMAPSAAARGAAGIAISPVHAQFSADVNRFSPYSPSSRLMLNVLHTGLDVPPDDETRRLEAAEFVDWPAASRKRLQTMRALFDAASPAELGALQAYRDAHGAVLETHARFEALHAHQFGTDPGRWHWRSWPEQFRQPGNPAVAAFARDHTREVALHAYMQMLADRSLQSAQEATVQAGMPIGLIADLAVGADSGGSHCWSRQDETLLGLTIGAPPDLLSKTGQNWGLAAFSPRGLVRHGFGAYLDMLRNAMRHAGGVRIDHAMGLSRLWVVPEGASSADGAYIQFPVTDMLRLIALESQRSRTVVLGEDLGTVPDGFDRQLETTGVLGMRVLWFERKDERFNPPSAWTPGAAAMTTTHDLPTVAGWWSGRDLTWRHELDLFGSPENDHFENHARVADRRGLWEAMRRSGSASGDPPPPSQPGAVVDAAIRHVGTAACTLAILPIEDALAETEQPNLPGTLDQHPNWRRRHPGPAASLLEPPAVAARLQALSEARAAQETA